MRLPISLSLVLLAAALPAAAGPLEDGIAAYNAKNFDKAVELLQPLAEKNNDPQAQEKIGRMYHRGKGLPKDAAKAAEWYLKAAEQGDAPAAARLGSMYWIGDGVARDPEQAAKWYALGAAKGNPLAQVGIGYMSMQGSGTPVDFKAAADWFTKSAEQGDASAMLALGTLYELGKGVPKDVVQAYKWYALATVDDGEYEQEVFDRARRSRDDLTRKITPAQVEEGEREARKWKRPLKLSGP
ncbi:MAG: sel1 repeat family protein [Enhydrobacter sp.]|nr:sel1 repeat family protein [Enhydrobacter sp.]